MHAVKHRLRRRSGGGSGSGGSGGGGGGRKGIKEVDSLAR